MAHLIALDWGTTSLRAYLLDASGTILERREGGPGIMKVEHGAFESALQAFCGDWIAAHPQGLLLARVALDTAGLRLLQQDRLHGDDWFVYQVGGGS